MNEQISDELKDLVAAQEDLFEEVNRLVTAITDRVTDPLTDALRREVEEKNQQLSKLNKELVQTNEALDGYKRSEEIWGQEKTELTNRANSTQTEIRRLKSNESVSIGEIKFLKRLVYDYSVKFRELVDMFDELCFAESPLVATNPEIQFPSCTAAFVCCGDDDLRAINSSNLAKIKRAFSNIDFVGDQPIFVSNKCLDRPNVPMVDLVILFTAGMSHTDDYAIRNNIRKQNPDAYILTKISSISLLIVDLTKWLSNPYFAKVSASSF